MTYREPARTAARRARSALLAALVLAGAALAGVGVAAHQSRRSSSASWSSPSPPASGSAVASPRDAAPQPSRDAAPHRPRMDRAPDGDLRAGVAGGAVPEGVTVFDDEFPAVAKLDPDLLAALRRAATEGGVRLVVNSGWRSPEYQAQLLREAVAEYGSEEEAARWVSTPETSRHVSGDAVDVGPSGAAAWLSRHGAGYGLCQIYLNEPWHFELRPDAVAGGCPAMYPDPTHDPRMQP